MPPQPGMLSMAGAGEVVLVTGGCGFVGRSLVRLLLENAENVAEIIVLDIKMPSEDLTRIMALKQRPDVPVIRFIECDIRNTKQLINAFEGVDVVMHLASHVDTSRCADMKLLHDINVQGTINVIEACKKNNISRLMYTSTSEINRQYEPRHMITETLVNVTSPNLDDLVMPAYSSTKKLAEERILAVDGRKLSNGKILRTIAFRPPGIYGEHDMTYVTQAIKQGKVLKFLPILGSVDNQFQRIYVGNVAWAHVHALHKLRKDTTPCGQAYHITDGSSTANNMVWMKPIMETQRVKVVPIVIPLFLCYYFFLFMEILVWLVSPFIQISLPNGSNELFLCCTHATYNSKLAKEKLGYVPFYSAKEAYRRSVNYYSSIDFT